MKKVLFFLYNHNAKRLLIYRNFYLFTFIIHFVREISVTSMGLNRTNLEEQQIN